MTVRVLIQFTTHADKTSDLLGLLARAQSGVIRAGCKHIALYENETNAGCVIEIEDWESASDHQAMMGRARAAGAFDAIDNLLVAPMSVSYLRLEKEKHAD